MMTPTLFRSSNGRVVHAAVCPRRGKHAVPWFWPEGRSCVEVKAAEEVGLHWCKICHPLRVIAAK